MHRLLPHISQRQGVTLSRCSQQLQAINQVSVDFDPLGELSCSRVIQPIRARRVVPHEKTSATWFCYRSPWTKGKRPPFDCFLFPLFLSPLPSSFYHLSLSFIWFFATPNTFPSSCSLNPNNKCNFKKCISNSVQKLHNKNVNILQVFTESTGSLTRSLLSSKMKLVPNDERNVKIWW